MGITDGKLLYFDGVAEENEDRKMSTSEYNNRTVYDWFNITFTDEFVSLDFNTPPTTFDHLPLPHKRALYTPDILPYAISVASEKFISNLTTP